MERGSTKISEKIWKAISSGKVSLMLPLKPNWTLKYSTGAHKAKQTITMIAMGFQ